MSTLKVRDGGILRRSLSRKSAYGCVCGSTTEICTLDCVLQKAVAYFETKPRDAIQIRDLFDAHGYTVRIAGASDYAASDAVSPAARLGLFVVRDPNVPVSGIVIDSVDNFKILARPLPDPSREANVVEYCLRSIAEYHVYRAIDGTSVMLYYVPRLEQWMIATARAFDVSNVEWIGQKTYAQIFAECAPKDFSYANLDKSAQYTFIIQHPDFHVFIKSPQLWQTSGPNIQGIKQYSELEVDVPEQNTDKFAESLRAEAMRPFGEILGTQQRPNYGYIFRHRGGYRVGGPPAAGYLESCAHRFVRRQMYDFPPSEIWLTSKTRPIYAHVRAYLSYGVSSAHERLFPDARAVYERMNYVIDVLTELTIVYLRDASAQGGLRSELMQRGSELFGSAWERTCAKLQSIALKVAMSFKKSGVIGIADTHMRRDIRDQYAQMNNIRHFVDILAH